MATGESLVCMYVCMYVWMGPFPWPASAKVAKHTYTHDILKLVFFVFLMFSSKNVALAVEMEIRVFEKTTDFPCWLYISMACIGKPT